MKKYKVLKELPGHIKGDIFCWLGVDEDMNGDYYTIRTLKDEGYIEEVTSVDLFKDELIKLMDKYGFKKYDFEFLYFKDSNGDVFRI